MLGGWSSLTCSENVATLAWGRAFKAGGSPGEPTQEGL